MFRLEKSFTFEAAHRLPNHDGLCARRHGHSFKGVVVCEGDELTSTGPKRGMLVDYGDMKAALKHWVENYLDHHDLNDTLGQPPWDVTDPTSEEVARWLFDRLKPTLPSLKEVRIHETCTSSATYRPIQE